MKINHIGIAVNKILDAIEKYKALGYTTKGTVYFNESRSIQVQYMVNGETQIELVSPLTEGVSSPVDRFIGKGKNFTMYHICYETYDILDEINQMKKKGYFQMEEPRESAAMGNCRTAYMFNKDTGLVELVEVKGENSNGEK